MPSLGEFLRRLFDDGTVVLRRRPVPGPADRQDALRVLESAFADDRLDLAGPPIEFDAPSALACSELVRQACWFLVSRSEPVEELERALIPPSPPQWSSEHFSGDLTLRFLPQVYRRARSVAPSDRLSAILAEVFLAWPLSGVLSDVEEAPTNLGSLGTHPGLLILYAERLSKNEKPQWMPRGLAMEYVELVYEGLGKPRPATRPDPEGVALG